MTKNKYATAICDNECRRLLMLLQISFFSLSDLRTVVVDVSQKSPEVGKAQLEAQCATSAIAEVALRFNFLFFNNAEVALRTKVFKICCALIALRFQIFFRLKAQFYTLNIILPHLDRNVDNWRPCLAYDLLFFSLNSKKCGNCFVL